MVPTAVAKININKLSSAGPILSNKSTGRGWSAGPVCIDNVSAFIDISLFVQAAKLLPTAKARPVGLDVLRSRHHHIAAVLCCRSTSMIGQDSKQRTYWQHRRQRMIMRSEEHTSELQSLMRISYAVFCLKTKNYTIQ